MSLSFRLLLALGSTAVFIGLAVLGRGGSTAFLARPPLVALVLVAAALAIAGVFVGGNISPGEREDRSNRWVLPVFTVLSLALAFLPAWADRRDIWTFGGTGIRWAGVALAAAGGALRLWPVAVLGRRFSGLVAIQPGHTLVTSGIYRRIRNPSYLGLLVNAVGWSLAFRSGLGLLLTALFMPPLHARMVAEERLLRDHFGAEYDAYRARTGRLIPGIY
ncbi:MAG: isoprenylcysteine carboxylmethyltransferase family protein [Rhodospirillales bacterium]|nr:isoprenylcysteine carboxylmethyltransferase family protein [Rhodospirillales bacterium]